MAEAPKAVRIVTGMHRSGTTWMGEAASLAMPDCVVHEPFNLGSGLKGVPCWYPGPDRVEETSALIAQMMAGRCGFRRRRPSDGLLRGTARQILGSHYDRDLSRALRSSNPLVLLKDPFLIRLCADLAERHSAKAAILIRHPAALVHSLRRMEWPVPELDGKSWPRRHEDPDLQFAYALGCFWSAMYEEVEQQLARAPESLLLMRHEDLCLSPIEEGGALLEHLDIPVTGAARDFLSKSTSGGTGEMSGRQLHNMSRDAQALAFSWRSSLPPEQISAVTEGAGATLARHYADLHAEPA